MNSAVGEDSAIGVRVGRIVSTVAVEKAVGGTLVGLGTDVDSRVGATGVVQAARRSKETIMNFFIMAILAHAAVLGGAYFITPAPGTALRAYFSTASLPQS